MLSRPTTGRRGVTALAVTALAVAGLGAGAIVGATSADAAPARHSYPGSVPTFVSAANDVGPAADTTVEGEVFLTLRGGQAAQTLATAVSTPGSSAYGKYLTPAQWISRFAPTQASFDTVKNYLVAGGATITETPASREYLVFRSTASATAAAFGTPLHDYRVGTKTVSAPQHAPSLPAAVASDVTGISLGNARAVLNHADYVDPDRDARSAATSAGRPASPAAAGTPAPCSSYFKQYSASRPAAYGTTSFPTYICGYTPSQLRSSADLNKSINAGYDGTGQTVAIIDAYASPSILQDTNDYMQAVGSPLLTTFSQLTPAAYYDQALCQQPSGWQVEQTLDVESAHGIAPGADILYVGGSDCEGGLDIALSKILDGGLASIVSNSYGDTGEGVPDDIVRGEQNLHIQAAGEGIGLYFSSGDSGDESINLGTTSPDFPASSPFVTAVGGTSQAIGARGTLQFQTAWGDVLNQVVGGAYTSTLPGDLYGGGSGGGTSALFAQPAYQKGLVPSTLSAGSDGTPSRVVPDIADIADEYTGFRIGYRPIIDDSTLQEGPFVLDFVGGTSLASPVAAAKMALVQQLSGRRIGFADPVLYAAAAARPTAFHDVMPRGTTTALAYTGITSGHKYLVTLDQDSSLATAKGYDDATGLGTLNVPTLAAYLSAS